MKLCKKSYIAKLSDITNDGMNRMNSYLIPSGGYFILMQLVTKASSLSTLVRLVMNVASKIWRGSQ